VIFQHFNLLPSWTALENVQAALHHSSLKRIERLKRARTILTELGLGQRLHHLPIELSVGQQQLVAVAAVRIQAQQVTLDNTSAKTGRAFKSGLFLCFIQSRYISFYHIVPE
jgi:putative ABC transport system ATP-binding protein